MAVPITLYTAKVCPYAQRVRTVFRFRLMGRKLING